MPVPVGFIMGTWLAVPLANLSNLLPVLTIKSPALFVVECLIVLESVLIVIAVIVGDVRVLLVNTCDALVKTKVSSAVSKGYEILILAKIAEIGRASCRE